LADDAPSFNGISFSFVKPSHVFVVPILSTVALPKLESLSVVNSYELNYFRGLKSLREIYV
jgi:hypothetical protein